MQGAGANRREGCLVLITLNMRRIPPNSGESKAQCVGLRYFGYLRGPYCPTSCGANLSDTESSSWMKGLQFLRKTISEHTPLCRSRPWEWRGDSDRTASLPVFPIKWDSRKEKGASPFRTRADTAIAIAFYCRLPEVRLAWVPIASPETTSSTLRFAWRPDALSFEATGTLLPKPVAVTELATTPCCTR
jgi:hypothetical protein